MKHRWGTGVSTLACVFYFTITAKAQDVIVNGEVKAPITISNGVSLSIQQGGFINTIGLGDDGLTAGNANVIEMVANGRIATNQTGIALLDAQNQLRLSDLARIQASLIGIRIAGTQNQVNLSDSAGISATLFGFQSPETAMPSC